MPGQGGHQPREAGHRADATVGQPHIVCPISIIPDKRTTYYNNKGTKGSKVNYNGNFQLWFPFFMGSKLFIYPSFFPFLKMNSSLNVFFFMLYYVAKPVSINF